MLFVCLIIIVVLGLVFELASRLVAFALLWITPILVALAAMQIALTLHPDDPGRVFLAFVCAAFVTRWMIGCFAVAAGSLMR